MFSGLSMRRQKKTLRMNSPNSIRRAQKIMIDNYFLPKFIDRRVSVKNVEDCARRHQPAFAVHAVGLRGDVRCADEAALLKQRRLRVNRFAFVNIHRRARNAA